MWYVLYTKPKAEIKVADALEKMNVEVYCPTVSEIRQWTDRKKKVTIPLFRSYVFVRLREKDRHKVFEVSGVVRYLYWLGKPALVRDAEIETIQKWLNGDELEEVKVCHLAPGDRVNIKSGVFKDEEAIVKEVGTKRIKLILLSLGCTVYAKTRQILEPTHSSE